MSSCTRLNATTKMLSLDIPRQLAVRWPSRQMSLLNFILRVRRSTSDTGNSRLERLGCKGSDDGIFEIWRRLGRSESVLTDCTDKLGGGSCRVGDSISQVLVSTQKVQQSKCLGIVTLNLARFKRLKASS